FVVADPSVSTAVYATLDSASDVDYFRFEGKAGETVLLELTIPQIEGQEAFAPSLALHGWGFASPASTIGLPRTVPASLRKGGARLLPPPVEARPYTEPFSGTSYWGRQSERVVLPADGTYTAMVWHPQGAVGRYTFVIGEREQSGGDPAFNRKLDAYWTPVPLPETPAPAAATSRCGD
ncbi:MAG: hypothetical protein ACRC1H_20160, partial [Caldilineaceae bacterium]